MKAIIGQKIQHQVVFIGSFGVGKTTAVQALSDVEVITMEATAILEVKNAKFINPQKTTTTVGFDYGEFDVGDGEKVSLYGIPGQARFEKVWDNLLPRCSGVVLWVFGNNSNYLKECERWFNILEQKKSIKKLSVALTRTSHDDEDSVSVCRQLVEKYHPYAPVLTADPRDRGSVLQAVLMALSTPYPDGQENHLDAQTAT